VWLSNRPYRALPSTLLAALGAGLTAGCDQIEPPPLIAPPDAAAPEAGAPADAPSEAADAAAPDGDPPAPLPAGARRLRLTWGHTTTTARPFRIELRAPDGLAIEQLAGHALEPGEGLRDGAWQSEAGGGDVDGVELVLRPTRPIGDAQRTLHPDWVALMDNADPDTARRLRADPAQWEDAPLLTVALDADGTRGFSVAWQQLQDQPAHWLSAFDAYLTTDPFLPFDEHQRRLEPARGQSVLTRTRAQPEATYAAWRDFWPDVGNPANDNPSHLVGLGWDGSIAKVGVDRWAGVVSDLGNPDQLELRLATDGAVWKGQRLDDALPIVLTSYDREGLRHEIEQLAYPLDGPPADRRGDIDLVLLQRITLRELQGQSGPHRLTLHHRRDVPAASPGELAVRALDDGVLLEDRASGNVLLAVTGLPGGAGDVALAQTAEVVAGGALLRKRATLTITIDLPAGASREILLRLPSPALPAARADRLLALDAAAARDGTRRFWNSWIDRGAALRVPEPAVNQLFRASLWHALRLPRRFGAGDDLRLDLPYTNFAYPQRGTPWPVIQSVYVDYMLYDLRGYHDLAHEELAATFRNGQQPDGRMTGYADWGVYTPSMLYAVAQHYRLSGDRASLQALLPATLRAMEWCLAQLEKARAQPGPERGLVPSTINDSFAQGLWSFTQAYFAAGLALFGQVLADIDHPRAAAAQAAAAQVRADIELAWSRASVLTPIVQLGDGSWVPFVPGEVRTRRRLVETFYMTDVDTGPLHLLRLGVLPAASPLADFMLADHEDNLFFRAGGQAAEPVYNPHATAYLLRDDAPAAIRSFFSLTACAFSQTVFEPMEFRWGEPQYFGPPSTDGAWFELYRNLLIQERDGPQGPLLVLGAAAPRAWLQDGQRIEVERAPTVFGPVSFTVAGGARSITADVQLPTRRPPAAVLLRLRHPAASPIRAVHVDDQPWTDFDPAQEWVRLPGNAAARHRVVVDY
jgi:hypothetical protein